MNRMKMKSLSIFYVSFLFLVLLFVQIVLYGEYFGKLKAGIEMINDMSVIRGSIQRYTKLELAGAKNEASILKVKINDSIYRQMDHQDLGQNDEIPYGDINALNAKLTTKWIELNSLINSYHDDPSRGNMLAVVNKSEECWDIANISVLREQYVVNRSADYYVYFTMAFGINLFVIALVLYLYKRFIHNNLANSAINDALTEVFNKGYFDEYLEHEIARAVRKKTVFSLIMLDIDRFKLINDTYGHHQGDYALKALAGVVHNCKRNSDVLSRVGGEEFIVLLPDTRLADATRLAERIRRAVEDFPFEEIGRMTVSLGVTESQETDNKDSILQRVDSALYKAKENGRNRSEVIKGEKLNGQKSYSSRT